MKKLSDIATISPGYSIKSAVTHDPEGTHQVIMGKHLCPGEPYYYEPGHELRVNLGQLDDKYLLTPGDILFVSRGFTNFPAVLKKFPQPAVAPGSFYVIRAKQDVMPDYLAWAMCQEPFQHQLKDIRVGSGTLMVNRRGLVDLTVPVPPIEMQHKIVRLGELMQHERNIRQEIQEETDRLHMAIGRNIINSMTDSK
jgi:restriction endonuclease S subunit